MLVELRIRNIAVIDSVMLSLAPALNVLTGETGAGKSLIVGALGLLLGDRAAGDRLRTGADRGSVEGIFELSNHNGTRHTVFQLLDERGIDVDNGTVVLKRELSAGGRSRAWINATPVTVAVLSEIGAHLVSVHGQHEAQFLMQPEMQRDVLDRYANAREVGTRVAALFVQLHELQSRANERVALRREAERRADYLRFLVAEISDANVQDGEDERIDGEIRLLTHAQEIRQLSAQAATALDGDDSTVVGQLRNVRRTLVALSRFDTNAERWLTALDEASYSLDEVARELAAFSEEVESNPGRLQRLESRRDLLHQLLRKYGPTMHDVGATLERSRTELELVDGAAVSDAASQREIAAARETLQQASLELTALRKIGAATFSKAVSDLLPELGMIDGAFRVSLESNGTIASHGAEDVAFQVVLNAGSEWRALSRVASGGELARIMLALSTVLARLQQVPTLVFDEVDAGVGGTVAWHVGALMRRVAGHHQVLAISHLAQIAARAHHHVVVRKAEHGGVTTADTAVVTNDARVVEIARMLGGDSDREVSRAHARELLDRGASDMGVLDRSMPAVGESAVKTPAVSQRRGKRV
ncbi:MAG: DNA repair protein RecN [Gemmatimonas sp.]